MYTMKLSANKKFYSWKTVFFFLTIVHGCIIFFSFFFSCLGHSVMYCNECESRQFFLFLGLILEHSDCHHWV